MKEQYKQSDLLSTFEVARSSYSYFQKASVSKSPERDRLRNKVISIHEESRGAAGSRSITAKLHQDDETIGRYKVASLMKEANIESKQPNKPHRYKIADKQSRIADNLLKREYNVKSINQVWCGDVTYVWCGTRWLYLALVIDLYARRIVGWACSDSPDTELTKKALKVAFMSRGSPAGVMFHSDQGCHYTSNAFQDQLKCYGMIQSMSRRGNCWDNVIIERTFRSLKTEWMPDKFYDSLGDAEYDIMQYIKYYNSKRCHSYNDYLSPIKAEADAA